MDQTGQERGTVILQNSSASGFLSSSETQNEILILYINLYNNMKKLLITSPYHLPAPPSTFILPPTMLGTIGENLGFLSDKQ